MWDSWYSMQVLEMSPSKPALEFGWRGVVIPLPHSFFLAQVKRLCCRDNDRACCPLLTLPHFLHSLLDACSLKLSDSKRIALPRLPPPTGAQFWASESSARLWVSSSSKRLWHLWVCWAFRAMRPPNADALMEMILLMLLWQLALLDMVIQSSPVVASVTFSSALLHVLPLWWPFTPDMEYPRRPGATDGYGSLAEFLRFVYF